MIKFHLYFDKDEETKWLNEMSAQGWALKSFCAGFYNFEKMEPGKYTYQIDLGEKFGKVSDDYRDLMSEMEVEILQNWGYWIILRKETSKGAFELYTDVESKIEHYTKILKMVKAVTVLEIICFFIECMAAFIGDVSAAVVAAAVILLLIIVLVNVIAKTKNIIYKLEEQRTGIAPENPREMSPLLISGLLLNACALMMKESVSELLWTCVAILGIVFMLTGIWQTAKKQKK